MQALGQLSQLSALLKDECTCCYNMYGQLCHHVSVTGPSVAAYGLPPLGLNMLWGTVHGLHKLFEVAPWPSTVPEIGFTPEIACCGGLCATIAPRGCSCCCCQGRPTPREAVLRVTACCGRFPGVCCLHG